MYIYEPLKKFPVGVFNLNFKTLTTKKLHWSFWWVICRIGSKVIDVYGVWRVKFDIILKKLLVLKDFMCLLPILHIRVQLMLQYWLNFDLMWLYYRRFLGKNWKNTKTLMIEFLNITLWFSFSSFCRISWLQSSFPQQNEDNFFYYRHVCI